MKVLQEFLFLLLFRVVFSMRRGTAQGWINDTSQGNCEVKRIYECRKRVICQKGSFEEKMYLNAFINHCFGVDQLQQSIINEFLTKLYSGQRDWREPLKQLVGVLYGSGLWTATAKKMTECNLLRPEVQLNATTSTSMKRREIVVSSQNSKDDSSTSPRYIKSILYLCPTNQSVVWKELFIYCDKKDKLRMATDCLCTENIKVYKVTDLCFDQYGYSDSSCTKELYFPCECTSAIYQKRNATTAPGTFQENVSSTPLTTETGHISLNAIFTKETQTKNPLWNFYNIDLRIAVYILCVCVVILLVSIIGYCVWKVCYGKSNHGEEDNEYMEPTDTSPALTDTLQSNANADVQTDSGYFCVGAKDDSLYHTIAHSFNGRTNAATDSNSMAGPPLPLRLFSMGSHSTESSSRTRSTSKTSNWQLLPQKPSETYDPSEKTDSEIAKMYASIYSKQEEQPYEIPIQCEQHNIITGHEYETEDEEDLLDKENKDERVNPLYAGSEDKM